MDWTVTGGPPKDGLSDPLVQIYAARDRGDVEYLTRALIDPENRMFAAEFLGKLGAVEATEPLMRLLDASDRNVRISAMQALGRLRARAAIPRLREVAIGDESDGVRSWAIDALGDIGDEEGVEQLISLLGDPSWRVRAAAAIALGKLGDIRALKPLRRARWQIRKSPVEWYLYRRVYNRAINALEGHNKSGEAKIA